MAVVAVGLWQGVATAQNVFTLKFTMTTDGTRTDINAPLQHGRPLNTGANYWIIHVNKGGPENENYYILFGPDPTPLASAAGTGIIRDSTADPQNQELAVVDGIAYIVGFHRPYGGSDGGSGVGEGTIFVVQGRPGLGEADRFVLLDKEGAQQGKLTVYKHNDTSKKKDISDINEFINVPDDGEVTGATPTSVRDDQEIRDMLWEVVKLADLADLRRPVPY
jgi:hypothetical protein